MVNRYKWFQVNFDIVYNIKYCFWTNIMYVVLVSEENEAYNFNPILSLLLVPEWLCWPLSSKGLAFYNKGLANKCYFA